MAGILGVRCSVFSPLLEQIHRTGFLNPVTQVQIRHEPPASGLREVPESL